MRSILWSSARVLVAAGIGVVVTLGISMLLPAGSGMALGLLHLVVCGSIGLVTVFGLCALLRVPEMSVVHRPAAQSRQPLAQTAQNCSRGRQARRSAGPRGRPDSGASAAGAQERPITDTSTRRCRAASTRALITRSEPGDDADDGTLESIGLAETAEVRLSPAEKTRSTCGCPSLWPRTAST